MHSLKAHQRVRFSLAKIIMNSSHVSTSAIYSTQNRFLSASQQIEEEENEHEMFIEDRSLSIAELHHKHNATVQEILKSEMTLSQLQSYYNTHYQSLQLLHHCYVLYRVNKINHELAKKF